MQESAQNIGQRLAASFWWVVGAMVVGVFIVTLFSPLLTVQQIKVARRDPRVDVELVEHALKPLFGKRMIFVSQQEVAALLNAELPEVKRAAMPDLLSMSISKQYPSTLSIELVPDRIVAKLNILQPNQQTAVTATGSQLRDFVTEQGMLVSYLPSEITDAASLPAIDIIDWGAHPQPWTKILSPEFLQDLKKSEALLNGQFGRKVQRRVVYLRAQEYHFLLDDKKTLWLDRKSTVEEQLARYRLFLQVDTHPVANQYIDLRLRDRIIYR